MFDENTGEIQQFILNADKNQMNFVKKHHSLNKIMLTRRIHENQPVDMNLISFIEEANWAKSAEKHFLFWILQKRTIKMWYISIFLKIRIMLPYLPVL